MVTVSTRFWNFVGNYFHSATSALVRLDTDVERLGLAHSWCSNWGQGFQSYSSTPISTNHFCMDLALCTGALSCWNKKGPSSNYCHKVGSTELSRMSLYALALRFPFTGTKGPSRTMKNSPDHYSSSTKLYSWHYALRQVKFYLACANQDSLVGLPDGEAWFITPETAFPLLQSPMVESFTPLQPTLGIALGDLSLVCGCSAISWS